MKKNASHSVFITVVLVLFWLPMLSVAWSQSPKGTKLSEKSIQAFFEKEVPRLKKKYNIMGVTAAAVLQGKVVWAKGYGWSDKKTKKAVDPNRSLFRMGSISKLFTWTAVMQLVEQGKLNLNTDIQTYLGKDVLLPKSFDKPITIAHLMAHTPGFEDNLLGLFIKDPTKTKTLKEVVQKVLKRVHPPGSQASYSNYGSMLAGYIVERVSGMPFEDYVKKHIFEPLGMKHSTFRQKIPAPFKPWLATGYTYSRKTKSYKPQAFEIVQGAPAGSVSMSATDLARFMIAHLQQGNYGTQQILKATTAQRMHKTHSRMVPEAQGMAHGFFEMRKQPRVLGHGGDTVYFHSLCIMLPKYQTGFVVSTNTSTGSPLYFDLFSAFLKHFFPTASGKTLAQKYKTTDTDLKKFVGRYHANRRSESNFMKLISLGMAVGVDVAKEGGLRIKSFMFPKPMRYVQISPTVFQEVNGTEQVVFLNNKAGKPEGLLLNTLPVITFVRPPWYETLGVQMFVLGFACVLLLTGFIFRPSGWMMFFSRKHKVTGLAKLAGLTGFFMILVYLTVILVGVFTIQEDVIFHEPNLVALKVAYLGLLSSLGMVYFSVIAWRRSFWGVAGRIHYSLLTIASLGLFWFLHFWKFI